MKFKDFSASTVAELLNFLADHEKFESIKQLGEVSSSQVKDILRTISAQLKDSEVADSTYNKADVGSFELSSQAMQLVSCLSPREETILFKSFKLV